LLKKFFRGGAFNLNQLLNVGNEKDLKPGELLMKLWREN
jgi:hypothetical protein